MFWTIIGVIKIVSAKHGNGTLKEVVRRRVGILVSVCSCGKLRTTADIMIEGDYY